MSNENNAVVFEKTEDFVVFRTSFYKKVDDHYNKFQTNSLKKPWRKSQIEHVINIILKFKEKCKFSEVKSNVEYYYGSRYDVLKVGQDDILIMKLKNSSDSIVQILPVEDYFSKLWDAHRNCGHGGRDKVLYEIKNRFYVPKPIVEIFVSLCKICQEKKPQFRKGIVVRPILSQDLNARGQVDLVDLQSMPDGDWKWLMNYQDHTTKFTHLRPLRSKEASGVAVELLKIFLEFGAPAILQSDNGKEFVAQVITELSMLWKDCKIIRGRPRHPESQGSVERCNQDIENMLRAWLKENASTKWSIGCLFVQFQKNSSLHRIIKRSPYRAVFGADPKMGLSKTIIPPSILQKIEDEDQLVAVLNNTSGKKKIDFFLQ